MKSFLFNIAADCEDDEKKKTLFCICKKQHKKTGKMIVPFPFFKPLHSSILFVCVLLLSLSTFFELFRFAGQKVADEVQFLVETMVLSCFGGLLGVALGLGIPFAVEQFTELKTLVMPAHPMMAFGISALVGIVFGIYPAWRAAAMDPVEALRHE